MSIRASPPEQFQSSKTLCGLGRGEIQLHQREGKALPPGAGIDAEGNPTTDPDAALAGAQLPFGTPRQHLARTLAATAVTPTSCGCAQGGTKGRRSR